MNKKINIDFSTVSPDLNLIIGEALANKPKKTVNKIIEAINRLAEQPKETKVSKPVINLHFQNLIEKSYVVNVPSDHNMSLDQSPTHLSEVVSSALVSAVTKALNAIESEEEILDKDSPGNTRSSESH